MKRAFIPRSPSQIDSLKSWMELLRSTLSWEPSSVSAAHLGFLRAITKSFDQTGAVFIPGLGKFWLSFQNKGNGRRSLEVKFRSDKILRRNVRKPYTDPQMHYEDGARKPTPSTSEDYKFFESRAKKR